MPINRDIFLTDPVTAPLPNDGVAEVVVPRTKEQWDVLRFEVSSFVCEGEYRRGLERILSTYLGHLTQPKQPAVWVSGFYGSGKSHFVRVLEYLWRDISFSDGSSARGLARLPTEIQDLLRELSTAGLREGGLWSAAGTLAAGAGSVRLALLAIVFRSAGLPEQYPLARFVLWLRRSAAIQRVEAALQAAGTDLNTELENFYVSPLLAQALVDTGVLPRQDLAEVQSLLVAQYPPEREEISDDEFLRALEDVLALQSPTPGRLPCTLIVFDELQQFISEDPQRTLHVQNVVEACSSRFGSRILFVATGQASLQGTPQLSKLQGRFTVRVMLSDTDVEQVVRQVVLRKKPAAEPTIRTTLTAASGEIDRHLAGTRIGAHPDDGADLVADYPLLPVRRRFWERVLRAIDSAGTAGQLRNQLRIVHEAARITASSPLGTVVGADFIYGQQQPYMLQSSVLLRDIANGIAEQADGTPEGLLRSRLCALVFLIGKLPTEGVAATGLSATADTLADLLVEDLSAGSASLRQRIPAQLERLVEAGSLMLVGDEYRLQTRESQEWEGEYRRRLADILNDESRISGDRTAELRAAVSALRKGGALIHGSSKTPRKFDFAFGADPPPTDTDVVPVWVRDESQLTLRAFQDEARAVGTESPIVFVFLPRHRNPDALRRALASYAAARETLNARPSPSMPEGIEARNAMQSRIDMERRRLDSLLAEILADATVLKGGGSQVSEPALQESIRVAVEGALVRLFPNFALAD
ncbi:MAG: BREX system P-loop protein BrxC, partial [Oscillochloris sp.]|nr:BREX system P-loop protein BrxC [Oscillochloris sp.]